MCGYHKNRCPSPRSASSECVVTTRTDARHYDPQAVGHGGFWCRCAFKTRDDSERSTFSGTARKVERRQARTSCLWRVTFVPTSKFIGIRAACALVAPEGLALCVTSGARCCRELFCEEAMHLNFPQHTADGTDSRIILCRQRSDCLNGAVANADATLNANGTDRWRARLKDSSGLRSGGIGASCAIC